ncbi:MAG TPA: NADP-specific glutamate dehydrogenase, partial [Candidatus Limnocylindria bacterium]|nr:NADP-specific glutamate dehydrogenase [Candidatus Limnocylindria bacterium]
GMRTVVSGSGNVALYAAEKAAQMGAKVVAMSDSQGYILDERGIDLRVIEQIKGAERGPISAYPERAGGGEYHPGSGNIWGVPCQLALPCATQNELDEGHARQLIANGVVAVAEGANMPATLEATKAFLDAGVLFASGKAANAGGVAVSALEMSQNSIRQSWSFDEVDARLKDIMTGIFWNISRTAEAYGEPQNYVMGANIAGFLKVADAMMAQGLV